MMLRLGVSGGALKKTNLMRGFVRDASSWDGEAVKKQIGFKALLAMLQLGMGQGCVEKQLIHSVACDASALDGAGPLTKSNLIQSFARDASFFWMGRVGR